MQWPEQLEGDLPQLNGHRAAWINSVAEGLRHPCYVIRATENDNTVGVLPLAFVKGPIFGKFLVSLPYINTGGAWARDESVAHKLVDASCDLADSLNVRYLELRHEVAVAHPKLNHQRVDKFHMRLALPATDEELRKSFKSKLRSQVKKSMSYEPKVAFGRHDKLDEFYKVFARNMRDLGTPVFSKSLFKGVLNHFEDDAEICIVSHGDEVAAAAMLVHQDGLTEVPSASCLREFNRQGTNMAMYWNLMARAIELGSHTFDFGRSSKGSGTYKFKEQWGAKPHPAIWQYYVRQGDVEAMRPDSDGNQRLIKMWQKLPVWFTKLIGPAIVRGIP